MAMFTVETGSLASGMVKDNWSVKMALFIKETGLMIINMAMANWL